MNRYGRVVECLIVRIAQYKTYIVDAFSVHVVDSVATATANTNNLNDAVSLLGFSEIQYCRAHILLMLNYGLNDNQNKVSYSSSEIIFLK